MSTEQKPPATTPSTYVCRSCKQPVDAVVERHKSMGVYVPHWTAGPCHNPRCDHCVPEQIPISSVRSSVWKDVAGWTGH
ncbi:hypothetical protein RFN58_40810 [Streptomyces iakyrus]|uniref:hypothetical protein n=1 Tax=Streptomyces iakyrus TaxID=68219 RepID=UPI0009962BB9|nr:hypothetical protein [Streptomyces iakyrus]